MAGFSNHSACLTPTVLAVPRGASYHTDSCMCGERHLRASCGRPGTPPPEQPSKWDRRFSFPSLPIGQVVAEVELPPSLKPLMLDLWLGKEALGLTGIGDLKRSQEETVGQSPSAVIRDDTVILPLLRSLDSVGLRPLLPPPSVLD